MTDVRISSKLRAALLHHHVEGMSLSASAKAADMSREGLRRALLRPAVQDLANDLQAKAVADLDRRRGLLRGEALDALAKLMREGKSETTRLKAAEILAAEKRGPGVAVQVVNQASAAPLGGYTYPKPDWLVKRDQAAALTAANDTGSDEES